jgi:hypothetical protein
MRQNIGFCYSWSSSDSFSSILGVEWPFCLFDFGACCFFVHICLRRRLETVEKRNTLAGQTMT